MRKITGRIEVLVIIVLVVLGTQLVGGIKLNEKARPASNASEVSTQVITPTPGKGQGESSLQLQQIPILLTTGPGLHGAFNVDTPAEVEDAAARGIQYNIIDYGDNPAIAVDVNGSVGQAMLASHMKGFLRLNQFIVYDSVTGDVFVQNEQGVRDLVAKYYQSSLLIGYWTKDDDLDNCDWPPSVKKLGVKTKSMAQAVRTLYKIIRSIDTNKSHFVVPGFGATCDVEKNYLPTADEPIGDILGLYPYPAYNGGLGAQEVNGMLLKVTEQTPIGKKPPKFIGIYQNFYSPARGIAIEPTNELLQDIATYINNGAISLTGFGWDAGDVTQLASNDQTLKDQISAVTDYLKTHPLRPQQSP